MKEKLLIKQDSNEMFPTLWGKRVYFTTKEGIKEKLLPLRTENWTYKISHGKLLLNKQLLWKSEF